MARARYYCRRAWYQVSTVLLFLVLMMLVDGVAAGFDTGAAANNKLMNFPLIKGTDHVVNRETGDTLDDVSSLDYDERRWAVGDVDMILRFKKKPTAYCTSYVAVPAENTWPTGVRVLLYMGCLFYLFLGVAIVADIFMGGIEQITAERETVIMGTDKDNVEREKVIMFTVWNDTVANLTLLALGSSAPEILLSVLETIQNLDKVPGELGPSTIVGSAAFNLLCISAVCMWSLENIKKIRDFGVFLITSFSSVFAYVWVLVVLQFNTPDVVDSWEAVVTFLFFPLLVGMAYAQDRNWVWFRGKSAHPSDENTSETGTVRRRGTRILDATLVDCTREEIKDIVKNTKDRRGTLTESAISQEFARKHPPKLNRGHYRMNAIRQVAAKAKIIKTLKEMAETGNKVHPEPEKRKQFVPESGIVEFSSPSYSVLECEGEVLLHVKRHNGSKGKSIVRYATQDLTGQEGVHYVGTSGEVLFEDGDTSEKTVRIAIIDNDVRNADMVFTVKLTSDTSMLGDVKFAIITIIDDDLPGEIQFASPAIQVQESQGKVRVKVIRENGSTGSLIVHYRTQDGVGSSAAVAPEDYEVAQGHMHFDSGETTKYIEIVIVDDSQYEKTEHFFVCLTGVEGKAGGKLGQPCKCRVDIVSDNRMVELIENVLFKVQKEATVTQAFTNSWVHQFRDAMKIGGEGEEVPNIAFVMHFFTFFWKVLFACIPPTTVKGGWACFGVSLMFIGLVTAMVAEIAGLLGCVMGLEDSVTAITFVALGTSLPDTFASMQAAEQEEYCDAAVGNVTGSNSVNVFLGLGLPWVIASIYYEVKGECYIVPAGALGFSVLVFTVCAVICICIFFILRKTQGGELGGPNRKPIAFIMISLWLIYVVMSSLKAYNHFSFPGTEKRCPCSCKNRGVLPWSMDLSKTGNCIKANCPIPGYVPPPTVPRFSCSVLPEIFTPTPT